LPSDNYVCIFADSCIYAVPMMTCKPALLRRPPAIVCGLFWLAAGLATAHAAAPAVQPPERGMINLAWENDIFAGEDNHFTNGVEIAYLVPPRQVPEWVVNLKDYLPLGEEPSEARVEFAAGHSIFTPESSTRCASASA